LGLRHKMNAQKKKIPIPDIYFDKPLHEKTAQYWELSRCWHGVGIDKQLNVCGALKISNNILTELKPTKILTKRVNALKDDIVIFGSKRNKSKQAKQSTDTNIVVPKLYVL